MNEETRMLVGETYLRTIDLFSQNISSLQQVTEMLPEDVILYKEDLERILGIRILQE